jgi:hypothetical protein
MIHRPPHFDNQKRQSSLGHYSKRASRFEKELTHTARLRCCTCKLAYT